ncbi:hypothetical protein DFH28DRAFT_887035, partial [Melampsora americana]
LTNQNVAENVQVYPQVCSNGLVQDFRHGEKWLSKSEVDLRAPILHTRHVHFYLYEPIYLKDGRVVTPTHFYYGNNILMAKVLPVEIKEFPNSSCLLQIPQEKAFKDMESATFTVSEAEQFELVHPNHERNLIFWVDHCGPKFWQGKACGLVIFHLPLTLHCDDTFRNISKQWKKHISYYIHMAGMPSNLMHLNFETLILGTSNTASELELGNHVVDQLKYVAMSPSYLIVHTEGLIYTIL